MIPIDTLKDETLEALNLNLNLRAKEIKMHCGEEHRVFLHKYIATLTEENQRLLADGYLFPKKSKETTHEQAD
jgi:hypothetical protein